MVTVTSRAKKELKRIVEARSIEDGRRLRLTTPPVWDGEGDFGIVIDDERSGDLPINFEGLVVLVMDPDMAMQLPKAILDFKDSPAGPRFTLDVF